MTTPAPPDLSVPLHVPTTGTSPEADLGPDLGPWSALVSTLQTKGIIASN
eukprot:CAMPEP_0178590016 /NCGR_PEP_ID=MMETSP0697-20121206/27970_1 /TAXON_ID=265572 /ORGANISM="Extubocellulus spinifer, Strain CCMP396" /LENGTH=49 /DNA_ID= /DNA_START= /DNA_END= /DNA_ORIENTATION=